jgi:RNA polymerase sigma-70 factor (ECF subfamily)
VSAVLHALHCPDAPKQCRESGHKTAASQEFCAAVVALRSRLVQRAARLCRNRIDAEDLAQDVIVKALLNEHNYRSGNLRAWLMTILRNEYFARYRRAAFVTSRRHMLETDESIGCPDADVYAEQIVDALGSLGPKFRDVLVAFATVADYCDAAAELGIPVGTFKSRVFRAREQLAAITDAPITRTPPSVSVPRPTTRGVAVHPHAAASEGGSL